MTRNNYGPAWDDELRQDLMRWLMEFGDGWVTAAERAANSWYKRHSVSAVEQTVGAEHSDPRRPQIFESTSSVMLSKAPVRLNKRALDFLKGGE